MNSEYWNCNQHMTVNQFNIEELVNKNYELNVELNNIIIEIDQIKRILKRQRLELIEQTKKKNKRYLYNSLLKEKIRLLKLGYENCQPFNQQETEQVDSDDDTTEFELFGSVNEVKEEVKERKEVKEIRQPVTQLEYRLEYDKLLSIFQMKVKKREDITIINNYVAIKSRVLFEEYCKLIGKQLPNETENSSFHFYRINVGYFNKAVIQLEELRESKGYSPNFYLIKLRYPYIQYRGIDPLSFI